MEGQFSVDIVQRLALLLGEAVGHPLDLIAFAHQMFIILFDLFHKSFGRDLFLPLVPVHLRNRFHVTFAIIIIDHGCELDARSFRVHRGGLGLEGVHPVAHLVHLGSRWHGLPSERVRQFRFEYIFHLNYKKS